jgi:hypothetical protein
MFLDASSVEGVSSSDVVHPPRPDTIKTPLAAEYLMGMPICSVSITASRDIQLSKVGNAEHRVQAVMASRGRVQIAGGGRRVDGWQSAR